MLGKLLKYDLRSIFKYWWIAAGSSVLLSLICGICISIVNVDYTSFATVQTFATLGIVLCVIGICVFPVLTEVLILVRFYKHFFTDEGYLTFTLPVSKSQLLNSKLIASFIFLAATLLLIVFDVFLLLAIGVPEEILNPYSWKSFFDVLADVVTTLGVGYTLAYAVTAVGIFVVSLFAGLLAMFACLTVASLIAKKHKILAAIGIYYAASAVLSTVMQSLLLDGSLFTLVGKIESLGEGPTFFCIEAVMLAVLAIVAACTVGLYMLEYWLLDRKLNLE